MRGLVSLAPRVLPRLACQLNALPLTFTAVFVIIASHLHGEL